MGCSRRRTAAAADVERCCRRIIDDKPDAVGLDIEWIATFRQGEPPRRTALIQLCYQPTSLRAPNAAPSAGDPAVVALLHVAHSGVPPALRTLLCGGEGLPLRVGVRVVNDMCKLKLDFRLGKIEGVVDSAQEAKRRCVRGHEGLSLDALCQRLLQRRLAKDPQVRVSDWEQLPLSAVQKQYAAVDAYASLVVFRAVMASPAARAKLVDATWRNGAVQS
ncbi:unnamed protein product [Pedinophyceae sp. YPF-701]|nr:unnamed protein product [Pedinophyceae sp. YPF-701]